MDELKKMRNFNNDIKTYEERKSHVESILNDLEVDSMVRNSLGDISFNYGSLESNLEDLGTYLIESKDIDSCRRVKDSFYRNDKYYNTSTSIGRNNVYVDHTLQGDYNPYFGVYEEKSIEAIENEDSDDLDETNYHEMVNCLLRDSDLKEKVKIFSSFNKIKLLDGTGYIFELLKNILLGIETKREEDRMILEFRVQGLSTNEIGEKIGIPRRTVSHRFRRLVAKI